MIYINIHYRLDVGFFIPQFYIWFFYFPWDVWFHDPFDQEKRIGKKYCIPECCGGVGTIFFFQSSTHACFWHNKKPQGRQLKLSFFRSTKNVVVLIPTIVLNQKKFFKQIFHFWDQTKVTLFKKNFSTLSRVCFQFSFPDGDSCVNLMTRSSDHSL